MQREHRAREFYLHLSLFGSILSALAGQADQMPEPYRHWLIVGGVIGTAISAGLMRSPMSQVHDIPDTNNLPCPDIDPTLPRTTRPPPQSP